MVARHGKLRVLFLDDEIHQVFLCRELVAQAHANVINAETDGYLPVRRRLEEVHGHLVVVVAYLAILSPYRRPRLVERRAADAFHLEPVEQ